MARLVSLLALTALLLAGCVGGEARRAKSLLADAEAASAALPAVAYEGELEVSGGAERMLVRLRAAVEQRDGRPTAQHVRVEADGRNFELVTRGGQAWVRDGGAWQAVPIAQAEVASSLSPEGLGRLLVAVEEVSVDEDAVVLGEPSATVKATVDGEELVSRLGELGGIGAGAGLLGAGALENVVDDLQVVIVVSDRTRLATALSATVRLRLGDETAQLRLALRLADAGDRVEIPSP